MKRILERRCERSTCQGDENGCDSSECGKAKWRTISLKLFRHIYEREPYQRAQKEEKVKVMEIELGQECKDKISGFKGMAVGRSDYLYGCSHICLQPKVGKDGKLPDSKWFDEPQVDVVGKKKIKGGNKTVGGPMLHTPPRR